MSARQHSIRTDVIAYRIWEQEGRPDGRAEEHWLRAEKLLEVEFRIGFPDATENEDPGDSLSLLRG